MSCDFTALVFRNVSVVKQLFVCGVLVDKINRIAFLYNDIGIEKLAVDFIIV